MFANPERGEVEVKVGDDAYVLKMSMRAARQLQKRNNGKTVGQLFSLASQLDFNAVGELMYGLLQEFHAKEFPSMKEVDELIDRAGGPRVFFDYCDVYDAMEKLRKAAKAPGVVGADDRPQIAQAGTGTDSELQLAESA
jgi:hypothetical protein